MNSPRFLVAVFGDQQQPSKSFERKIAMKSQDVDRVVDALRRTFGSRSPEFKFESWPAPALNVLDCVLSLNRSYHGFCEHRVDTFAKAHPEVESLEQLLRLIESYPTPLEFSAKELDYNHKERAEILVGVINYLIGAQKAFGGKTEMIRLGQWASSLTPQDYEAPGVRGFALSGFQYLRMLFGADTAKPDVHIRRFVSEAVGRKTDDAKALALLEVATKRLGWSLLAVDNEIWKLRAEDGQLAPSPSAINLPGCARTIRKHRRAETDPIEPTRS